jgi:hypothetical protein
VPPEPVIGCEQAAPTVPEFNVPVVSEGAGLILTEYVCDPESRRAATEAVAVNV